MILEKGLISVLPVANQKPNWPWTVESDYALYKSDWKYPKISVIVPSYNQGKFLEETLRSIILQNYPNFEIIIIDGGSTDDTIDVIKKYEPWIYYWVSEKDGGQSDAINKGIKKVTGEFLGWQNSDDIYSANAFYHFAETYNKNPGNDVYFGNMLTIDQNSKPLNLHRYAPFSFNEIKFSGWNITNQACFFSRNLFDHIKIKKEFRYVMDGALFFDIANRTNKFVHIKQVLGCFRLHEEAKSSTINMSTGWDEWVKLRSEFGIVMKPDVPWNKQFVWWKLWFKIRKGLYYLPEILSLKKNQK